MRNTSFAFFAEGGELFRNISIQNLLERFFVKKKGTIYKEIEDTFFEEEKCGLNEIEYLEIIEPYQALKKNSPFREIMKTK